MLAPPHGPPLGLRLSRTAKAVSEAFDAALAEVGGSRPAWLILMSLKAGAGPSQRHLAETIGIRGATLTQHLANLERRGLLTRRRDPGNRRVHVVALTAEGEAAFRRMRDAAVAFDRRLRSGLDAEQTDTLEALLDRLRDNVISAPAPTGSGRGPEHDSHRRGAKTPSAS
ncbi:MarR family winged helix-turn-helix transcriptional regulator [Saccharomonospora xinjiangensis]|uniref:MarR family winged helix-turn-helix transcriptional regulator n=1 Tax=Saccharomonospora xinjiangensis TaxID=75294 RepID=UPI00143069BE|nr:MarR family winged helix-turn-helix transcriptional regulator [Saccharomonospora xinjiangensis]